VKKGHDVYDQLLEEVNDILIINNELDGWEVSDITYYHAVNSETGERQPRVILQLLPPNKSTPITIHIIKSIEDKDYKNLEALLKSIKVSIETPATSSDAEQQQDDRVRDKSFGDYHKACSDTVYATSTGD